MEFSESAALIAERDLVFDPTSKFMAVAKSLDEAMSAAGEAASHLLATLQPPPLAVQATLESVKACAYPDSKWSSAHVRQIFTFSLIPITSI